MVNVYKAAGERVTESDLVAKALSQAGMRPPERFFLNYPHELSGGQRQRVVIAGALGGRALGPDCRRAGLVARRVDPRRDPGAAAEAARGARAVGARRHARPRAGVEHRRPDRGDVPRPDRRGRHHRGGALLAEAPVHERAAVGRPRDLARSSRSCSRARHRTRPACPGDAGSTRAARRSRTARRPKPAWTVNAGATPLPVLPAEGDHRAACWLHLRRPRLRQAQAPAEPCVPEAGVWQAWAVLTDSRVRIEPGRRRVAP